MRTITLQNASGTAYDLSVPGTALLVNPGGLGFNVDADYTRIGNTFVRNYYRYAQGVITGTIVFNGYSEYLAFINFISVEGLIIKYQPSSLIPEYRRDVDFAAISKSELGPGGTLECEVQINCKTPWHIYYSTANQLVGNVLTYSFNNDGQLPASWSVQLSKKTSSGMTNIVGVSVTWNGTNYTFTASATRGASGTVITDSIEWNAFDGEASFYVDGAPEPSMLTISSNNFFKIPRGESGTFTLRALTNGSTAGNAFGSIRIRKELISV